MIGFLHPVVCHTGFMVTVVCLAFAGELRASTSFERLMHVNGNPWLPGIGHCSGE
jgi:hypothetical protein